MNPLLNEVSEMIGYFDYFCNESTLSIDNNDNAMVISKMVDINWSEHASS